MTYMPDLERGYREGMRDAVTWLHARAVEMNDPHARAILNSAATNLGWDRAHRRLARRIGVPERITPASTSAVEEVS